MRHRRNGFNGCDSDEMLSAEFAQFNSGNTLQRRHECGGIARGNEVGSTGVVLLCRVIRMQISSALRPKRAFLPVG